MLNKFCGLLFVTCILFSCQKTEHKRILDIVKEWDGKEITFPTHSIFTIQGYDTISYKIPKSDYKVVVFVDSVGCISCKLQLPNWKKFMHEVDSLCDGNVPFVFFFQSKNVRELRNILRRDSFSYPICIDTEDSFNKLNRFPDVMTFQTFLVDSGNRVKVIGNPIHNLSVKELYLKELTGMKSNPLPVTTVHPDSTEYHYGTVGKNKKESKKVILHNTGKEVFRIKGVTTSCDCMTVEYGWDEILPGESAVLTVKYKAEEPGDFWRTITVYGNIPEKSFTLDFWGTVKK